MLIHTCLMGLITFFSLFFKLTAVGLSYGAEENFGKWGVGNEWKFKEKTNKPIITLASTIPNNLPKFWNLKKLPAPILLNFFLIPSFFYFWSFFSSAEWPFAVPVLGISCQNLIIIIICWLGDSSELFLDIKLYILLPHFIH